MRSKLYDAFCEAAAAAPTSDGVLTASAVPGRTHDYIFSGPQQQPVLLLSCASPAGLKRPPINLQHVTVEFGIRFRIRAPSGIVEDDFIVIALRGGDIGLAEAFCLTGDALTAALPDTPSASQIERIVREFVKLLSALSLPSTRAVAGLWAELWLMTIAATNHHTTITAWHADPTDKFDFSFPCHFVEVKATEHTERSHEFSYEQLRRSEIPIKIASLKLRRAQNGKSITDLVSILQTGLSPELRVKLVRNVFGAIGSAVSDASEIRYDESFAGANLRVISAAKMPTVVIPEGSPITSVRFRINLDDSSVAKNLLRPEMGTALAPL